MICSPLPFYVNAIVVFHILFSVISLYYAETKNQLNQSTCLLIIFLPYMAVVKIYICPAGKKNEEVKIYVHILVLIFLGVPSFVMLLRRFCGSDIYIGY